MTWWKMPLLSLQRCSSSWECPRRSTWWFSTRCLLGLPGLVGAVKGGVARRLLYVQYRPEDRPHLDPANRARLIEVYREGVEKLARLTGRDLRAWLQVERSATPGAPLTDYEDTRAEGP